MNSAADFFVRRIEGWRDELEVLKRGARFVVFRPSTTLFVLLKSRRLSEQGLEDCRAAIGHAHDGRPVDTARILAALDDLAPTDDDQLTARREALRSLVTP